MAEESLILQSKHIHELTGFNHKQQQSRVKTQKWGNLENSSPAIVRPSEIQYLKDHQDELINHRMFYKPIWHTLILLISLFCTVLIGGGSYFAVSQLTGSSAISSLVAMGAALVGGVFSFLIFGKGIFPAIRQKLYSDKIKKFTQNLRPTPLGILLDEVDQFNETAEDLEKKLNMVNNLESAGHDMEHVDLSEMLEIYGNTREDLVRALKTERVFRENPGRNLDDFPLSFQSFTTDKYDNRAQEFKTLLKRANEVGQRVQERMKDLAKEFKEPL